MKKFKNEYLNVALRAMKFKELTTVQEQVIEIFDKDRDLVIEAKTGSGKTHAFLLPILDDLDISKETIHAVILAPTRELATQIHRFTMELVKHSEKDILVDLFIGGEEKSDSMDKLKHRQPHLVIGTPGRIHDLVINENVLKIYNTNYFVIDEADMTLDNNFLEIVDSLAASAKEAQFMVFSATIPEKLKPFLRKYMDNPIMINVHPEEIANLNIKHYFIKTKEQDRFIGLKNILSAINPYLAIVFCNTKDSANLVFEWMKEKGLNVTIVHGDIDFRKRKQIIKRINSLEFQYIVATDILARGIDIIGVSHIINYELPKDYEFYIHRSGRTGRINFDGECISLYEFDDNTYLDKLEAKGIKCEYKQIKKDQFTDAFVRKGREKRTRPENELDYQAKARVKKPKKVKPGYKKKYQQKVDKEKKVLSRKKR